MSRLEIHLLGPLQVTLGGEPVTIMRSDKVLALLSYLAVEADQPQRREKLAGLLWPDFTESSARTNLRRALADLRKSIGDDQASPSFLLVTRQTIQFNRDSDSWLDVSHFKSLSLSKLPDSDHSIQDQSSALNLYKGDFMEGFSLPDSSPFEEWLLLTRQQLRREFLETSSQLVDTLEAHGEIELALPFAWRQLEVDPARESTHRQLMRLLALNGQRDTALAQYETCSKSLSTELGVEPAPETQQLYLQILRGEWPPVSTSEGDKTRHPPRQIGECPYLGLASFQEDDAAFFFGRESFVDQLLESIQKQPGLTAVLGSSGSGKSSVVQAGLLPQLRLTGDWLIASFRPGGQPFFSLASAILPFLEKDLSEIDQLIETQKLDKALADNELSLLRSLERLMAMNTQAKHLLIIADQFEEIFTLCREPDLQYRFLDQILEAVSRNRHQTKSSINFLLTMRADFMGQALAYRPFADALQQGSLMLGPMTRDELRSAIEEPASKQGAAFEEGLINRLLDDVGAEPGSLPLLEFTLTLLWDQAESGWLTHSAYEQIGYIHGALAAYADKVYDELDDHNKSATRQVFVQLVRPGEGTEDTRRMAKKSELGESNWHLVQFLADKRLVVTGRNTSGKQTAEVVHEALIYHWSKLRGWINEERTFRIWQEGIRASAAIWNNTDKDEGALLRGAPLAESENWLVKKRDELSQEEIQFISNSIKHRELRSFEREQQRQRELTAAQNLAKSEKRRRNILLIFSSVLIIAIIIAASLLFYSNTQRRAAIEAYSVNLAANAKKLIEDGDSTTALALALQANDIKEPPAAALRVLLDAAYSPGPASRKPVEDLFEGVTGPATALKYSPDGKSALIGMEDGTIIRINSETLEELTRLDGHSQQINDIAFHPGGQYAVSAGDDALLIVWDLRSGNEIGRFSNHSGIVRTVDITQDGELVVSGGFAGEYWDTPGELILWQLETGKEVRRFPGHVTGVVDAEFSLDDQAILASSGDTELLTSVGYTEELGNQQRVHTDVLLWDIASGEIIQTFDNLSHEAFCISVSQDGKQALVSSYFEAVMSLLDITNGDIIQTMEGSTDAIRVADISNNGKMAISGSEDGAILLWDLSTGEKTAQYRAHEGEILDIAISSDGLHALSSSQDDSVVSWEMADGQRIRKIYGHEDMVFDVAFFSDGTRLLSSPGGASLSRPSQDRLLRMWNLESEEQLATYDTGLEGVLQVAISPDGNTALFVGSDPFVHALDIKTWQETELLEGHEGMLNCIEFLPDSTKAVSCSSDGTLILWDILSGEIIHRMDARGQSDGLWSVAVSPDGRTALSDSGDSSMILWDLESGQELRSFLRDDYGGMFGSSGMAYLPDGKTAISAESDGSIVQWDLETGEEVRRFGEHQALRTRVVVTPDGRLAVTGGMDGRIMVWDISEGRLVRQTDGHGVIFDLTMAPDGESVYFGSSDATITEWRISNPSIDELREWIELNRYVRDLTCGERELYQIEPLCSP